jgi:hypothetical protein
MGDGEGIHGPELDEDISVEGLLAGRRSGAVLVVQRDHRSRLYGADCIHQSLKALR